MRYLTLTTVLFLLIALAQPSTAAGEIHTTQFQQWFWQYRYLWPEILHDNCSAQYEVYLSGHRNRSNIDWRGGGGTNSAITQPVIKCMLDNSSEYVKSIMTSAQVMLGITPTILAVLGASHESLAVLTVVGHRPFLALLIALGSPSVYLSRAFNHVEPKKVLKKKDGRLKQSRFSPRTTVLITILEYAVAMTAVANVSVVSYELGVKSISSIMSNSVFPTMIWTLLVIPIHFFGAISMRLRVRRQYNRGDQYNERNQHDDGDTKGTKRKKRGHLAGTIQWFRNFPNRLRELSSTELIPTVSQESVKVKFFKECRLYIFLSWALSTGIICHIIFGTFLMSSFLFLGPNDAMGVAGRYMASVLLCRILLMYEIAGIRERVDLPPPWGEEVRTPQSSHVMEVKRSHQNWSPSYLGRTF